MINCTQSQVPTVFVDFGGHSARHEPNIGSAVDINIALSMYASSVRLLSCIDAGTFALYQRPVAEPMETILHKIFLITAATAQIGPVPPHW